VIFIDDDSQFRLWFMRALSDLKYMGVVSTTKQHTFIFKKNVFGKAKYYKAPDNEQMKTVNEEVQTFRRQ
jgi:hypothetical protein